MRITVILPDSIRNYMIKYLSDDWMYLNEFLDENTMLDSYTPKLVPNRAWRQEYTVRDLLLKKSDTVSHKSTISETIKAMRTHGQILVVDDDNKVIRFSVRLLL